MSICSPILKAQRGMKYVGTRVRRSQLARQWRLTRAEAAWRSSPDRPKGKLLELATRLKQDGIVITSVDELGIPTQAASTLIAECRRLCEDPDVLAACADRRADTQKKIYFHRLLGHQTIQVSEPNVFTTIALDQNLLRVVNEYLGCYAWLMRYNVWLNMPATQEPTASQLWHRDQATKLEPCVKVFLLAEAVGPENGPFHYAPRTQAGGDRVSLQPPCIYEGNRARTLDEQMEQVIPREEWVAPTGNAGTIVIADTSGYHKGGWVRKGRRLLFKIQYGRWDNDHGAMVRFHAMDQYAQHEAARWATLET